LGCDNALPLPMGEVVRLSARRRGHVCACKFRYAFVFSTAFTLSVKNQRFLTAPPLGEPRVQRKASGAAGESGCGPSGTPAPTVGYQLAETFRMTTLWEILNCPRNRNSAFSGSPYLYIRLRIIHGTHVFHSVTVLAQYHLIEGNGCYGCEANRVVHCADHSEYHPVGC